MSNKLTLKNNWGFFIYEFEGKKVDPKRGKATIKFPDGIVYDVPYYPKDNTERVSDMGREYTVTSKKLYATIIYHGQKFEVELSTLNVIALK